jgi:type IV secretion system pilin
MAAQNFQLTNPLGSDNLEDIFKNLASAIIDLAIPVAVAMYLYAGFLWLTAGSKPENVSKAKTVFKYTTLGLIVIFIGGGFVDLIRSVLNLGN